MKTQPNKAPLNRVLLTTAICAQAFVLGATALYAQESENKKPAKFADQLEEVLVTAQKKTENLQDVPFSVSALSGNTLERFKYKDLKDLNGIVPNVLFTQITNVALNLAPSIRGIGITNNPDPYTGTEVAIVADGVVQGTRLLTLADQFDIERIEVLRGPQGTLFGANTLGGVVNIVTRQPTGELGAYGKLTVANHNEFDGAAAVNFPLVKDVLAGKVSLSHRERDGFYRNLADGTDLMWIDSSKARGYLLYTPNEDVRATLTVGTDRIRNGADTPVNISQPGEVFYRPTLPQGISFDLYTDSPQPNDANLDTYTLNTDWDTNAGQITAIANYLEFDAYNVQDVDSLPEFILNAGRVISSWQYSGEVRDAFQPTDQLDMQVGVFYMKLHHDINTITLLEGLAPNILTEQHVKSDEKTIAIFGQMYWDFTEKLRLGVGLRWTKIDINLSTLNTTRFNEHVHPYNYKENLANSILLGSFEVEGDDSWDEFGGKISLDYQVTPDVMLYGYYARGFKSGGFNGRITVPEDIGPFGPEFIDSFEVGMRSDWMDNRLRLNLAAFYNEWDDMQVPQSVFRGDPPQASSTILNAASATTQGAELELEAVPAAGLTLRATLGYLKSEFDKFTDVGVDYSGRSTPYAPKWTGSLMATYDIDTGYGQFTPAVQYTYTDKRWAAFTQYPQELMGDVNIVNANITFSPSNSNWSLTLWSTNLFDEDYRTGALTVPPLFSFAVNGAPRQYGVDVSFDF